MATTSGASPPAMEVPNLATNWAAGMMLSLTCDAWLALYAFTRGWTKPASLSRTQNEIVVAAWAGCVGGVTKPSTLRRSAATATIRIFMMDDPFMLLVTL